MAAVLEETFCPDACFRAEHGILVKEKRRIFQVKDVNPASRCGLRLGRWAQNEGGTLHQGKRKLLKRPDPIKNVFVTHSPIHELAIRWGVGDVQGCQWLMPYKWDSFLIGRTKLILKHQYRYLMHLLFRLNPIPTAKRPHLLRPTQFIQVFVTLFFQSFFLFRLQVRPI